MDPELFFSKKKLLLGFFFFRFFLGLFLLDFIDLVSSFDPTFDSFGILGDIGIAKFPGFVCRARAHITGLSGAVEDYESVLVLGEFVDHLVESRIGKVY